jgi:dolichol-phosphate mannosyltransferase
VTVAVNFFLNNRFTFRGARLKGVRAIQGLGLYYLACSIGLFAQVNIASSLQRLGGWWGAATLAGIGIGSIWNYSMACLLVWRVRRHRTERLQFAYANPAWFEAEPARPQTHTA